METDESDSTPVESLNDRLRIEMLDHLAGNDNIHFKNQQINDPELTFAEKRTIAEELLNKSSSSFLNRFGIYLKPEYLSLFESESNPYEVEYYVDKLKRCQCKPVSDLQRKNRRFEAMKRLFSSSDYFSVNEMRKRNPLLFEQLLGNFLDDVDIQPTELNEHTVVNVILEQIDEDQVAELKKIQMEAERTEIEQFSDSSDDGEKVRTSKKLQKPKLWGTYYSRKDEIGEIRWKNQHVNLRNTRADMISENEKTLLMNEFTSVMFSSFLEGKDEVDYNEIDNNSDYDDINQCDADEQEKYFDSESPTEEVVVGNPIVEVEDDDEDELDKYMKNIASEIESEDLAVELRNKTFK